MERVQKLNLTGEPDASLHGKDPYIRLYFVPHFSLYIGLK
jgi:hypothetical protein